MGSEWIAHSVFVRKGYWLRGHEGERKKQKKSIKSKPDGLKTKAATLKKKL